MEIPNNGKQIPTDITEAIKENNISTTQGTIDGTTGTTVLDGTGTTGTTVLDGTGTTGTTVFTNTDASNNAFGTQATTNAGKDDITKEKNQNDITSFNKRYLSKYGNVNTMELSDFDTTDPLGASVTNYRQGILNSIARWNSKSAATNYTKRLFKSNPNTAEDMKKKREKRIREALNQVLSIDNLGEYQAGSAFFDAALNMVTSKKISNNVTQGGKYKKNKKNYTRRYKKNYTRRHKK
jgi:hypothetical protein